MNKILKTILILVVLAVFTLLIYKAVEMLGITDINTMQAIVNEAGILGWLVFSVIMISVTTLLCFVPMTSAMFIGFSVLLFGPLKGFLIGWLSVFISSSLMFLVGRKGGPKLASLLVGEEELNKARELIGLKSITLLPMMFLFPVFPDDALCVVAGMSKMRYWYFAVIVLLFRGIGIASISFGIGLISIISLTLTDYLILGNLLFLDILLIFRLQPKIENWLQKRRGDK